MEQKLGALLEKSLKQKNEKELYKQIYWCYFLGILHRKEKNQMVFVLEKMIINPEIKGADQVYPWIEQKLISGSVNRVQNLQEFIAIADENSEDLDESEFEEVGSIMLLEDMHNRETYEWYDHQLVCLDSGENGLRLLIKDMESDCDFKLVEEHISPRIWMDRKYGILHISYGDEIQQSGLLDLKTHCRKVRVCDVPTPMLGVYQEGNMTHLLYHRPGTHNIYDYKYFAPFYEAGEEHLLAVNYEEGADFVVDDGVLYMIPGVYSTPFYIDSQMSWNDELKIFVYPLTKNGETDINELEYYKRCMICKLFLHEINYMQMYYDHFAKGDLEHDRYWGKDQLNCLNADEMVRVPEGLTLEVFQSMITAVQKDEEEYRYQVYEEDDYNPLEHNTDILMHAVLQLQLMQVDSKQDLTEYLFKELSWYYQKRMNIFDLENDSCSKMERCGCFRFETDKNGKVTYDVDTFSFYQGRMTRAKDLIVPPNPFDYPGMIARERVTGKPVILWKGTLSEIERYKPFLAEIKEAFGYKKPMADAKYEDWEMRLELFREEKENHEGEVYECEVKNMFYDFPELFLRKFEGESCYVYKDRAGVGILSKKDWERFVNSVHERFGDSSDERRIWRHYFAHVGTIDFGEDLYFQQAHQHVLGDKKRQVCMAKTNDNGYALLVAAEENMDKAKSEMIKTIPFLTGEFLEPSPLEAKRVIIDIPEELRASILPVGYNYYIEDVSEENPLDDDYVPELVVRNLGKDMEDRKSHEVSLSTDLLRRMKDFPMNDLNFTFSYMKESGMVYLDHWFFYE